MKYSLFELFPKAYAEFSQLRYDDSAFSETWEDTESDFLEWLDTHFEGV